MSANPEAFDPSSLNFSISFGALDEASLADFKSTPSASASETSARRSVQADPTPQNTNLWRMDLTSSHAPGRMGAADVQQSSQKYAALSMGEELRFAFAGHPAGQAAQPVNAAAQPIKLPDQLTGGIFEKQMETAASLEKFEKFLHTYHKRLIQNTLVETAVDGQTVARTYISQSGDFRTIISGEADDALTERHLQVLRLTQARRLAYLRMIAVIDKAVYGLSQRTFLSPVILLPMVYKFVQDLVKELQSIQESG